MAQLNESDTAAYQLNIGLRGSFQTGNVELLRILGEIEGLLYLAENWVVKSQNNYLYQEIFENKADNNILSQNYLYFKPQNHIYPYAIGFASTNFRRNINTRYFVGAGLTREMLTQDNHSLKLSANIVQESTHFSESSFNYPEFNGSSTIDMWRATLYARGLLSLAEGAVIFNYEAYWQQSLRDRVNYRYYLLFSFDFSLMRNLYLQTRAIYGFENVVTQGVDQQDLLWTWGLSYKIRPQ